jgi:hypothetical protein
MITTEKLRDERYAGKVGWLRRFWRWLDPLLGDILFFGVFGGAILAVIIGGFFLYSSINHSDHVRDLRNQRKLNSYNHSFVINCQKIHGRPVIGQQRLHDAKRPYICLK